MWGSAGSAPCRAAHQPSTGVDLAGKAVNPLRANPGEVGGADLRSHRLSDLQSLRSHDSAAHHQYAGKAAFWLVYPDKSEISAAIEQHLHDFGYKLSALHDPQHELVKLGQVQITPEVAVFDASGQLVYHGRIDNWYETFGHARTAPTTHELDDAMQAVLNGNKPAGGDSKRVGCYISDLE